MNKSLLLGLSVLLLSAAIVGVYGITVNSVAGPYAEIVKKLDEIRIAIQNKEMNPSEPQPAYCVEEILLNYHIDTSGSTPYIDNALNSSFAFPNGKEWSSVVVTKVTFVGYTIWSQSIGIDERIGITPLVYITINGVMEELDLYEFKGSANIDPALIHAGTNHIYMQSNRCEAFLEKIIIEYQITPAN